MSDAPLTLEYAFAQPVQEVRFSPAKFLALGYVAFCVVGLIAMGVIMALQI